MSLMPSTPTTLKPGFRLQKLEVRNWGTFNGPVWKINPEGHNALLTGDIGSGKSTLVDALTTLLVPHNRITYNRAAGADGRERSPLSYILGEYKNVQSEVSGSRKAQYLRHPDKDYSVLLATFADETLGQVVSLAQTFWIREGKVQKFFLVADRELSIVGEFGNFGSEMAKLKKRLRDTPGIELFDSFSEYAGRFSQLFGILQRETALDLFFQTVSMKSVGNITDFVRNQMLGRTDVRERISTMTRSFDDLRQSHDTVRNVRDQITVLQVLVNDRQQYNDLQAQLTHLQQCRVGVPIYLAYLKVDLLKTELHRQNATLKTLQHELTQLDRQILAQQREQTDLQVALKSNEKGRRLDQLSQEIQVLESERDRRWVMASAYAASAQRVDLPEASSAEQFFENQRQLPTIKLALTKQIAELQQERDGLVIKQDTIRQKKVDLEAELRSLEGRRTKIPGKDIDLRQRLVSALNLTEADLPFAGELLKISDGEDDWEGAIERRLHGLGLTLLVSSVYYDRVSEWVNSHSLAWRIWYIPIPANYRQQKPDLNPLKPSLVNKVHIRNDTEFYDWLMDQLLTYHDLTCCETMAEFRRESFAITREGQIKVGKNGRHEKDDRTDIRNRSLYLLGWSNADKVKTLRHQLTGPETDYKTTMQQISRIDGDLRGLNEQQKMVERLDEYTDFAQLDWADSVRRIEQKTLEKKQLESESDELKMLREQLKLVEEELEALSVRKENKGRETGKTEAVVRGTANDLYESFVTLQVADEQVLQSIFPDHEQMLDDFDTWLELIDEQIIPVDRITDTVRETLMAYDDPTNADRGRVKYLADTLPKRLDRDSENRKGEAQLLRDKLIRQMGKYRTDFPAEAADISDDMQDIDQYEAIFNHLTDSELARHEERFRELLQKGTIHEVALFHDYLDKCNGEITEKIMLINEHLRQVNYNPNTYIELTRNKVVGGAADEIEQFRSELRTCLSDTLGGDPYSEDKYVQVKQLLDRFESTADDDQRWTARVTDVRQWYTFGASERHSADHTEKEFYSDSGGKSGGQKEKLAYTVLASAIAYQFGLNEQRSRTFRFVMIDEAFGRGSDESTRHGLELFHQMNIQLLIVTPLQKINIIEPYISAVHFVSNETGQHSQVRTISKIEYEQEKARYVERELTA